MRVTLNRGLYVITDCNRLDYRDMLDRTASILAAGVAAVQYRDKSADMDTKRRIAVQLHDLCREHGTPLIVNDDVELTAAVDAEGIHLGREDGGVDTARQRLGDNCLAGISCYNNLGRALTAAAAGADYVAFGAMFPTGSKDGTVPATPELISHAKAELSLPVAAIGGITPENCRPLVDAGADLLAVISSVYLADDPAAAVRRFNEIIFSYGEG